MTSVNAELFHREQDRKDQGEPPCLCGHSQEHHHKLDRCTADDCGCRRYDADWDLAEGE